MVKYSLNSKMRKYILYILILATFVGIFGPVARIEAQGGTSEPYKLLAPLPCSKDTPGCESGKLTTFNPTNENGSALGSYLNLIVQLVIGISAILAVVMIVMGGIEYMGSELISSKEAGKDRIKDALLGLLIALGAYALLNTINPSLLKSNINIPDAKVTVVVDDSVPQTPVGGKYKNGIAENTPLTGTPTPLPPGVTLNAAQCTFVGQRGCTSTIGLNMSQVQAIQRGCNCNIVITGGTEWWLHGGQSGSTTHQNGSSTVDLRPNPQLNAYLSGGKPLVLNSRYPPPNGPYYWEGDHWHIGR